MVKAADIQIRTFLLSQSRKYPRIYKIIRIQGDHVLVEKINSGGTHSWDWFLINRLIKHLNDSRVKAVIATPEEITTAQKRLSNLPKFTKFFHS